MLIPLILTLTCTPTPNSTGLPATLEHQGGTTFEASQLPPGVFAGLLVSPSTWPSPLPWGDGWNCLNPYAPGAFRWPQAQRVDAGGVVEIDIAGASLLVGTTYYAQAVYRDPGFGLSGWNLTGMASWTVEP